MTFRTTLITKSGETMRRTTLLLALFGLLVHHAAAHFSFVLPQPGQSRALLVISEVLQPDPNVNIDILKDTRLALHRPGQEPHPLSLQSSKNAFAVELPAKAEGVIAGVAPLGTQSRGGKTYRLTYHPKTILGDPFSPSVPKTNAPVELLPAGKPGTFALRLLIQGKPAEGAEVTVLLPDGTEEKMVTAADGTTPALSQWGRFGAWARYWDSTPGQENDKSFDETRHYATIVCDVLPSTSALPAMPQAVASFGAAADGGYLYVYGGHVAPVHQYSTEAVTGAFRRLNLTTRQWEPLPSGPALQGMNLAVHNGKIYRAGGMQPRNAPGTSADNHSVDSVARFDPATGRWEEMPPLPEPRSSHDVAVVGDWLIVNGGWKMQGAAGSSDYATTTWMMNLTAAEPVWEEIPQPFRTRAHISVAHEGRLYVVGGFTDQNLVSSDVHILDPKTRTWSKGPRLPARGQDAFAPAGVSADGQLYVSLGPGSIYRLSSDAEHWHFAALASPRISHRMAAARGHLLIAGGAARGGNLDLVEAIPLRLNENTAVRR